MNRSLAVGLTLVVVVAVAWLGYFSPTAVAARRSNASADSAQVYREAADSFMAAIAPISLAASNFYRIERRYPLDADDFRRAGLSGPISREGGTIRYGNISPIFFDIGHRGYFQVRPSRLGEVECSGSVLQGSSCRPRGR